MAERKYNDITEEQHRLLKQRRDRTLHRLSLDPTQVQLARNRPDKGSCNIIELNGDGRLQTYGPGIYTAQLRHMNVYLRHRSKRNTF